MSRVGEKIRQLREKSKMTQKKLGKKIGVSEKFINEVELGKRIINQDLIDRIGKLLGENLNDITMFSEEQGIEKEKQSKFGYDIKNNEVKGVWKEAFGSVLKDVPIYRYNLNKIIGTRKLPIVNNKIEGHPQDKIFYLEIENDDMIGFRIAKGDLALAYITKEIENNSIYLLEYNNERKIRQIKKLDSNKFLLISNSGTVMTNTLEKDNINIIARLEKLEIKL